MSRGSGWGQGSRFGATPKPEGAPVVADRATAPDEPKRRRKKKEPAHPRHTVAAVSNKVTLHRDKQGTPHIVAKQEHDAWAALGFCCGQDRLWQMDILRRVACGRVAEILGADWLEHDSLVRTAGVGRRAAAAAQRMQGVAHEMLTAYAGGVNAARALSQPPEATALGYEIAPWTVADSLSLELYGGWSLACRVWPLKLLAAQEAVDTSSPGDLEGAGALWGRLDYRAIKWGESLRAPDVFGATSFVTPTAESVMLSSQIMNVPGALGLPYAAHLRAPGLSIAGLTMPGSPNFLAGRNETLSWSASPVMADDVDLVMEELDGIGNFRGPSGREKAARRQELIRVRDGEDRRIEVVETRHGPLLSVLASQFEGACEDQRVSLAVRWGLNSLGTSFGGWLALARSENMAQAAASAESLGAGPLALDVLVADAAGQHARLKVGRIPVRGETTALPVRGWHPESRWRGARTLEAEGERLAREGAGWLGVDHTARRRLDDLLAGEVLDGPGAALVLSDVADAQAAAIARALSELLEPESRGGQLLRLWSGATVPESAEAAFFWTLVLRYLGPKLYSPSEYRILAGWPEEFLRRLGESVGVDQIEPELVRHAAQQTEESLDRSGSGQWRWDSTCRVDRSHLLGDLELFAAAGLPDRTRMGSPGAIYGVRLSGAADGVRIRTEPCARIICDLGTSHAALVIAGGSSGVPTSVHFADQIQPFAEGRLTSFPVNGDVEGELIELHP